MCKFFEKTTLSQANPCACELLPARPQAIADDTTNFHEDFFRPPNTHYRKISEGGEQNVVTYMTMCLASESF